MASLGRLLLHFMDKHPLLILESHLEPARRRSGKHVIECAARPSYGMPDGQGDLRYRGRRVVQAVLCLDVRQDRASTGGQGGSAITVTNLGGGKRGAAIMRTRG